MNSVKVEIEAELVIKSCILYFCGWVGGRVGVGDVKKFQLSTKLKLKYKLNLAKLVSEPFLIGVGG